MKKLSKLYPLKFKPIIKSPIWGGNKLHTVLKKDFGDAATAGESWEISCVEGNVSEVTNGELAGQKLTDLIAKYKDALVGKSIYENYGTKFPLLIKFIDANDDLSVQVHPNDELAKHRHNSFGKTEMWYVMESEENGALISGFKSEINPNDYKTLLKENKFLDVLGKYSVSKGDLFFIPAGKIHGIGKHVMVAEIQQTSDITYRVFDYNRVDAQGNQRQLHVDEALDAIDFKDTDSGKVEYEINDNEAIEVIHCPYFITDIIKVSGIVRRDFSTWDSFKILMNVEGDAEIVIRGEEYSFNYGETILIPAEIKEIVLKSESAKFLEVHL